MNKFLIDNDFNMRQKYKQPLPMKTLTPQPLFFKGTLGTGVLLGILQNLQ